MHCTDCRCVITLYAVWTLNVYTISYDLGSYAASTTHANPTSYSIKTGAEIILKDLTPAKSEFRFGGWYTEPLGKGEKVERIDFQGTENYTLYAKWEHAGKFSVVCDSTSKEGPTKTSNFTAKYRITRTIPTGAVAASDTQTVYVRTQNGTAYGTTVEGGTGQDKYHFIHSYKVLTFGPEYGDGSSQEFTVKEKDTTLWDYITASYRINSCARNYYVEIYKIENTANGLTGTTGTARVQRTMPYAEYYALSTSSVFYNKTVTLIGSTPVAIRSGTKSYMVTPYEAFESHATDAEEAYRDIISAANSDGKPRYEYSVTVDLLGSGTPLISLYTDPSDGGDNILRGHYQISGLSDTTYRTATLPVNMADKNKYEVFKQGDLTVGAQGQPGMTICQRLGGTYGVIVGQNAAQIKLTNYMTILGAEYNAKNLKVYTRLHDASAPVVQYAAPLATTPYQKGDKAYITVIYNEPIKTITGTPTLTLKGEIAKYFGSAKYVSNAAGTNALVFEVTALKDITATEIQNKVNLYLVFPESTGGTFSSKIGTLSATVADYCGNK